MSRQRLTSFSEVVNFLTQFTFFGRNKSHSRRTTNLKKGIFSTDSLLKRKRSLCDSLLNNISAVLNNIMQWHHTWLVPSQLFKFTVKSSQHKQEKQLNLRNLFFYSWVNRRTSFPPSNNFRRKNPKHFVFFKSSSWTFCLPWLLFLSY